MPSRIAGLLFGVRTLSPRADTVNVAEKTVTSVFAGSNDAPSVKKKLMFGIWPGLAPPVFAAAMNAAVLAALG